MLLIYLKFSFIPKNEKLIMIGRHKIEERRNNLVHLSTIIHRIKKTHNLVHLSTIIRQVLLNFEI